MPTRQWSTTLAILLLLAGVLGGCATQRTFDRVTARSAEVKRAIANQADDVLIRSDDEQQREERIRYLAKVTDVVNSLDRQLLKAMTLDLTPRQERVLESAYLMAFDSMELYARFPGRVRADGTPADAVTQQTLNSLTSDAGLQPGP